jgi:endonuclease-3
VLEIIRSLRRCYGKPPPPISRDPFQLILWEQVAYLASDDERRAAFEELRKATKLTPSGILAATPSRLTAIARMGGAIAAADRAERMRRSAELVIGRWRGDLREALKLPLREARRALAAFPMIGEPGADKILVFMKAARLLPLDSNGLRVLQRLGIAPITKDYRSSYRGAQEAVRTQLPPTHRDLMNAFFLLREHGQKICRRTAPDCPACPLRADCPTGRDHTTR